MPRRFGQRPGRRASSGCGRLLKLKRQGSLQATHFTWEITITPRSWPGELLRLYFNNHGMLPRYNRATSPLRHEIQTNPHFA